VRRAAGMDSARCESGLYGMGLIPERVITNPESKVDHPQSVIEDLKERGRHSGMRAHGVRLESHTQRVRS
jgi:hypothetical protein